MTIWSYYNRLNNLHGRHGLWKSHYITIQGIKACANMNINFSKKKKKKQGDFFVKNHTSVFTDKSFFIPSKHNLPVRKNNGRHEEENLRTRKYNTNI